MGRRRPAPEALLAAVIVLLEVVAAGTVGSPTPLALAALVVAPGLAVRPFLPDALRTGAVGVAAVPVVGLATVVVLVVSVTAFGAPLEGWSVRTALAALVVSAGVGSLWTTPLPRADRRVVASQLLGLVAVLGIGAALQARVVGRAPLPGQDWGEYLLYAREIAASGSLQIDNPFWMLGGQSFPLDPGVPSVYGAFLLLTHGPPTSLLHGIWVFALLAIVAVFVLCGALWGPRAGLVAAAVYAVVPMNLNMLSWHGAPNTAAFSLLALSLLAVGFALRGAARTRWAGVLGVALVALAATHRYSFVLTTIAVGIAIAIALVRHPGPTARFVAWTALVAGVAGLGVGLDLVRRSASLGGLQGYQAYLSTKAHWDLVARDLTWAVAIAGLAALVGCFALRRLRSDDARFLLLGLGVAIVALTYAWLVHVPTAYNRASYFAPLLAACALGLLSTVVPRAILVPLAVALVLATGLEARGLASDYRGFYQYVDQGSLRGLGLVVARTDPGDVVVTDSCWAFLAPWLVQRPVLGALDEALILPRREVEPARLAHQILVGANGAAAARRIGARYALVDPQCISQNGSPVARPRNGELVFASTRLLVYHLG